MCMFHRLLFTDILEVVDTQYNLSPLPAAGFVVFIGFPPPRDRDRDVTVTVTWQGQCSTVLYPGAYKTKLMTTTKYILKCYC